MKIQNEPRDDNQVKLIVEFDPGTLDSYKQRAARELARKIKIPGFRPGKAPYGVIARQVGEPRLTEEGLELLVDDQYPKIVKESGIQPYTAGQLENIAGYDPLVLEFIIPLEPETKLGDYHSIRRPFEPKIISDSDVDEVVDNLRDRQAVLEPANRPAEVGDVVTVVLSGKRTNPEEGSEEKTTLVDERSYQILVREKAADDEWPFPGFSQNLVGLSIGDQRDLDYEFGDDFQFESLRGVKASYHFIVEDVKSRTLPALDDDFAKTVGDYETLESLKAEILTSLNAQNLEEYQSSYDDAIVDELLELSTIKFPPQMLESEQNTVVDSLKHRLEQQNSTLDLYLKARDMDLDALKEEAKPVAEKRLKRSLALLELANEEKIQVSEEDLQKETTQTLQALNQSLDAADVRRLTDQRVMNNLVGNVMLDMLTQRAQQRLRDIAQGKITTQEEVEGAETSEQPELTDEPEETSMETGESEIASQDLDTKPTDSEDIDDVVEKEHTEN